MGRALAFVYGIIAYFVFFITFLYAIGFVGNVIVSKSVDTGTEGSLVLALVVNVILLSVFALQHTIMARPKFKTAWTKIIPQPIERSTYVLLASLALILIFWQWRPMLGIVWNIDGTIIGLLLSILFWFGWAMVLTSTFLINHFDLFGLRQVYLNFQRQEYTDLGFRKLLFYKLIRHPLMTGFIIAFWATPIMTVGHLVFAVVTTAYIYIAVMFFEEKDLVAAIGEKYTDYQKEVGAFFPGIGKKK